MAGLLSRQEFESALQSRSKKYWDQHPFHLAMHEGRSHQSHLQLWAANRWFYQSHLPQKDAAIIANCPIAEVRRTWLSRITYQDGALDSSGGIEAWLRLCEAVGLSKDAVVDEHLILPGVRVAVNSYVDFALTRSWIEGVAASLTELFSPKLMRDRNQALRRHYGFIDREGLGYLDGRPEVAEADAAFALTTVLDRCQERGDQDRALAALDFKCDLLWTILDAIQVATTSP